MKKCLFVFMLLVIATLITADGYAFRCNGDIISQGDSTSSVYSKCGKPRWQETVQMTKGGTFGGQVDHRGSFGGQYSEIIETVEKWYYNCGQFDFVYVLTTKAGQVIKIDTERRGTGKSQCEGN